MSYSLAVILLLSQVVFPFFSFLNRCGGQLEMERQKEVISPLTSRLNGSAQSANRLLLFSLTYQIKGKSLRGKNFAFDLS